MSIEKMREQFEHHIRKSIYGEQATNEKLLCLARNGYGYSDSAVCRDWMLWQASRADINVELREAYRKGWDASGEGWNAEHPGDCHEKESWQLDRDEALGISAAREEKK